MLVPVAELLRGLLPEIPRIQAFPDANKGATGEKTDLTWAVRGNDDNDGKKATTKLIRRLRSKTNMLAFLSFKFDECLLFDLYLFVGGVEERIYKYINIYIYMVYPRWKGKKRHLEDSARIRPILYSRIIK